MFAYSGSPKVQQFDLAFIAGGGDAGFRDVRDGFAPQEGVLVDDVYDDPYSESRCWRGGAVVEGARHKLV